MDTSGSTDQLSPVRVLLVDDDAVFAKIIGTHLKKYRPRAFQMTWKESVESALAEIAQNSDIDIILTDYIFPTSNGLEFCLQLNQMDRSIPIMVITNVKDFKLAVEAMKLGVEDFLLKEDLDEARLPRTILSIIERVKLRKHKQAIDKRLIMAENCAQAIRELVVTVCHEFNNPLAAVKISFDLLHRQIADNADPSILNAFEDSFNRIDFEIKRLRDLNFERIDFSNETPADSR
jgi:CheY-like chemotaxis protein